VLATLIARSPLGSQLLGSQLPLVVPVTPARISEMLSPLSSGLTAVLTIFDSCVVAQRVGRQKRRVIGMEIEFTRLPRMSPIRIITFFASTPVGFHFVCLKAILLSNIIKQYY
jgi:hypothetical protein